MLAARGMQGRPALRDGAGRPGKFVLHKRGCFMRRATFAFLVGLFAMIAAVALAGCGGSDDNGSRNPYNVGPDGK